MAQRQAGPALMQTCQVDGGESKAYLMQAATSPLMDMMQGVQGYHPTLLSG